MFHFIRFFAVGLLVQGPMSSLGIKCYYNNNGLAFYQMLKLFDLKLYLSSNGRDQGWASSWLSGWDSTGQTLLSLDDWRWVIETCFWVTSHLNIRPISWQISATLSWVWASWPAGPRRPRQGMQGCHSGEWRKKYSLCLLLWWVKH